MKGSMRENGFRAIGGLTRQLTSGLVPKGRKGAGKGGGAPLHRLKADWSAIVGAEIARASQPEALLASRGARAAHGAGKTLRLRVAGAASLEIQHMSGRLVERVNGYFGHRLIDDIRLVQGGIAPAPAASTTPRLPDPDPASARRIAERVETVQDPDLKAALARLGTRIAASRRSVVLGGLGTLLLARAPRAQQPTEEQARALAVRPDDHVLGKPDAPNLIIDYFSLTCPHCANFAAAVLPGVRKQFVDTGQARFVYRHFPSDSIATHASQLAECAGPNGFFDTIDVLFRSQVDWLTASEPEAEMAKILEKRGVAAGQCLTNDRLLDKIIADVETGQTLGVHQTPTLFINGRNCGNPGGPDAIGKILRDMDR
ncbi:DciA family protein [Enhydrobacter sp.]|uniref:DciA family protein n=1 Tax=Enhydrobacter sp. TaxID=1894999 RepID=UPI002636D808|nr:DciA family protein [Enhydrobacter sp.]WIM12007.1 MAG: Periplasmic thiol:disulfide interchange protein DsbA [Enhydrobacter sp.]